MNAPDLSAMNGRQLREYNRKRLDEAWAKKHPYGMGYIIEFPVNKYHSGDVYFGIMSGRPTSSGTSYKCHGSRSGRDNGFYAGAGFYTRHIDKGTRHRTFTDMKQWREECLKLGITPEELPDV